MGLAMSPWMDAIWPGWVDLFGGRQSARTIHFVAAWLLVAFVLDPRVRGDRLRALEPPALDDHRPLSRPAGGFAWTGVDRARRRFFARTLGAAGALALAGCERLSHSDWFPKVLGAGETASSAALRTRCTSRKSMAQEFTDADRSPTLSQQRHRRARHRRVSGAAGRTASPTTASRSAASSRSPRRLSLAELRALPSRTQITRHDCVEGWSAIAKWKGARLAALLERRAAEAGGALRRVPLRRPDGRATAPISTTRASISTTRSIRRRSSPTR